MVFMKNVTGEVVFGGFSTSWHVARTDFQCAPSIPGGAEHRS